MLKFGAKYWLLSCAAGMGLVLVLFQLTETRLLARAAFMLLWPGAAVASLAGFGSHDLEGFVLYIVGNMLFYCVLFLALFRFLRVGARGF